MRLSLPSRHIERGCGDVSVNNVPNEHRQIPQTYEPVYFDSKQPQGVKINPHLSNLLMDIEQQIQPVVTVAAFDPLLDKVVSLERSANAVVNAGLHELVGGKVEELDGDLLERLILEVRQEIGGIVLPENLSLMETSGIPRKGRSALMSYRYVSALQTNTGLDISPEEALEHPKFDWVDASNFEALNYVPGVRDFLHRLFEEFKRTGTLLSTLKQPVYVRPSFFDYEGERVLVPMEERKGGMPKHYLREEHLHLDEVIGSIVHEYLGEDRKLAKALRMRASSRKLIWREKSTPIWQLDYGIEVSRMSADRMVSGIKKRIHVIPANPTKALTFPQSFNTEAKRALQDIHKLTREAILLGHEFPTVRFEPKREAKPIVR